MQNSNEGTFIGYRDEEWGLFINHEWQVISRSVDDCIKEAEAQGYTVDYELDGELIKINKLTKN